MKSNVHPLQKSSIFGRILFSWLSETVKVSNKVAFKQEMHYDLPKKDKVDYHYKKLSRNFDRTQGIFKAILITYPGLILFCLIFGSAFTFGGYYATELVKGLMHIIFSKVDITQPEGMNELIWILVGLCTFNPFLNMLGVYADFIIGRNGISIRAAIYQMLQKKILKFSTLNSRRYTDGYIVNLLQIDSVMVNEIFNQILQLIKAVAGFIFGIYFIMKIPKDKAGTLVVSVLVGLLGVDLLLLITYVVNAKIRAWYLNSKDGRMSLFRNVLSNLQFIKINGLENYFALKIYDKREKEIKNLRRTALTTSVYLSISWFGLGISIYICMRAIQKFDIEMDAANFTAFVQIYNGWRRALNSVFAIWAYFMKLNVSVNRINRFLKATEKELNYLERTNDEDSQIAIKLERGFFRWKYTTAEEDYKLRSKLKRTIKSQNKKVAPLSDDSLNDSYASLLRQSIESHGDEEEIDSQFQLKNIDLEFMKGEKIAVIGKGNSGKSSLLYALLGEMIPTRDSDNVKILINGTLGYLGQSRWVSGGTVKDNILVGKPYNSELMNMALRASQMLEDLKTFPNGLDTVMSDSGSTVSGGQKARIGLARCFYHNPDILILDDPTSSLDNNTTTNIMEILTKEDHWKQKTLIFTTNNMKMLDYCTKVIFLAKGRISFMGTPQDLQEDDRFKEFLNIKEKAKQIEETTKRNTLLAAGFEPEEVMRKMTMKLRAKAKSSMPPVEIEQLTQNHQEGAAEFFLKEDKSEGSVSISVLWETIHGMGGWLTVVVMISASIGGVFAYNKVNSTIQQWGVEYYKKGNKDTALTPLVLKLSLMMAFVGFTTSIVSYWPCTWLAEKLHSKMIFKLLHAKITEFLHRVPTGTLLNRFSTDIDSIDNVYAETIKNVGVTFVLLAMGTYALFSGVKMTLILIPCGVFISIGFYLRKRTMAPYREIARLSVVTKSPIIGLGNSTTVGGPVIRSLQNEDVFNKRMEICINENTKNNLMGLGLQKWFNAKLTLFNVLVLLIPAYTLLGYTLRIHYGSEKVDGAAISYFLTQVIAYAGSVSGFITLSATLERLLISAERCKAYEEIESEVGYKNMRRDKFLFQNPKNQLKKARSFVKQHKRANIFSHGKLEFNQIYAQYPTSDAPVLKNINLLISGGEKVGIVGRSGAGKSSFIKLIWRALDPAHGEILIDGVDIRVHDLKDFRQQFTIVSQSTNLFEGTLYSNIIRERNVSAAHINAVKEELLDLGFPQAKLFGNDLSFVIESEGSNLSQSEKQIISMVQALQRNSNNSKVVILDEATAYVDSTTEQIFRDKLEKTFKNSTIFVIAHRISNVMGCDRVLVFDDGMIVQDGHPTELLKNENGIFYDIWSKM